MIASFGFFFLGRLRVPTRRCDLVVPANWGWGRLIKRYKKPVRELQDKVKDQRMLWTYLFPAAFAAFKVGCRVESFIRRFLGPPIWDPTTTAELTIDPLARLIFDLRVS